jgi:hypothetical protein
VNAGPKKNVGHAPPGDLETKRGELLHMDFGVMRESYPSDLQRVWCLLGDGRRARRPRCGASVELHVGSPPSQLLLDLVGLSPDWPGP